MEGEGLWLVLGRKGQHSLVREPMARARSQPTTLRAGHLLGWPRRVGTWPGPGSSAPAESELNTAFVDLLSPLTSLTGKLRQASAEKDLRVGSELGYFAAWWKRGSLLLGLLRGALPLPGGPEKGGQWS